MKRTTLFIVLLLLLSSCEHAPYVKWQWHSSKSSKPTNKETYSPEISVSPEAGAFNPLPTNFIINFPSDLDLSNLSPESLNVTGSGSCSQSPLLAKSLSGNIMTLTLNPAGCAHGDEIIIELKEDLLFNKMGFKGVGSRLYRLRLDQSFAPAPTLSLSSRIVSTLPNSLDLSFDAQINMDTIGPDIVLISGSGSCVGELPTTLSKSGSVATFSFDPSHCIHGDRLTLQVDQTKFKDVSGFTGIGTTSVTIELDNVGPLSGELGVITQTGNVNPLPSEIKIRLPADVDPESITLADFTLNSDADCAAATLTGISVSSGMATLGLESSSCTNGGTLSLIFNLNGVQDLAGNPGSGNLTLDWKLISSLPAAPIWNVYSGTLSALPSQIDLNFDSTINKSSVLQALTINAPSPCPQPLITGSSWSGQSLQLFTNSSGCAHGTSISLSLDMTKVKNLLGQTGTGSSSRNFIMDLIGPASPTLQPGEGSYLSIPSTVEVLFGDDTDMSTITTSNFIITGSSGCAASPLISFSKDQNRLLLGLDQTCTDGGVIQFTLDLSTVRDHSSNSGSGSFSKSFIMNSSLPSLPVSNRVSGTTNSLPGNVELTFANDIDMLTVDNSDFTVTSSGNCASPALSSFSKLEQKITLNLNQSNCSHSDGLFINLDMSGIKNTTGTSGTGLFSQSFILDTQGPHSASLSPLSSTYRNLPSTFNFTFSSDTDMNSVTASDFTLASISGCTSIGMQSFTKTGQNAALVIDTSSCLNADSFTISLDMSEIQDATGNNGSGIVSGTYVLDTQGPASAELNLLSATRVTMPDSVFFTFSIDTSMETVTATDFSVSGTGGCSSSPLLSVIKSGQTATLNLNTANCVHGSSINVSLAMSDVADTIGNPGSGVVAATYVLDTQGPAYPSVSHSGGTFVTMPNSIVYSFTSDTDMSTVSVGDFSASTTGLCNPSPITGFTKSGQTATITLHTLSCVLSSSITLRVDMTGVTDLLGNPGTGTFSQTYTKGL